MFCRLAGGPPTGLARRAHFVCGLGALGAFWLAFGSVVVRSSIALRLPHHPARAMLHCNMSAPGLFSALVWYPSLVQGAFLSLPVCPVM